MKHALGLVAVLILTTAPVANAQAPSNAPRFFIPARHRITVPGACLYDSASSVALTHGYEQARTLAPRMMVERRIAIPGTKPVVYGAEGRQEYLRAEFDKLKVPYGYQPVHTYDWRTLQQRAPQGVVVQMRMPGSPLAGHSIVVIRSGGSDGRVHFWDSSAPTIAGSITRADFAKDWYGNQLWVTPKPKR